MLNSSKMWLAATPILGIISIYLFITLPFLDTWPPLQYDECWIGSVGYNIYQDGKFSTHVFGDFLNFNQLSLDRLPLHSFLQAATFKLFGFGIWQLRLPSVLMGLGVILITYKLIKGWLGIQMALVGAAIIILGRICFVEPYLGLGILDVAMNARHDITVAFFSSWSFNSFIEAEKRRNYFPFINAGIATGLAVLTHLYALILPAIYILYWLFFPNLNTNLWRKRLFLLAIAVCIFLPWGIFVALNWHIAKPQFLFFQGSESVGAELSRFSFLSLGFYTKNIIREYLRYFSIFKHAAKEFLPGILVLFTVAGFIRALLNKKKSQKTETHFLVLALPSSMFLLAAFETFKYPQYLTFLMPLWIMAMVFAWQGFWQLRHTKPVKKYLLNFTSIFIVGLFLFQSIKNITNYVQAARTHVTFAELHREFSEIIPKTATIVASLRYWPAFRDQRFYDYQVPTARIRKTSFNQTTLKLNDWFQKIRPDFLIYDDSWRKWAFEYKSLSYSDPQTRKQLKNILEHDYQLLQKKNYPGYGEIAIYQKRRAKIEELLY